MRNTLKNLICGIILFSGGLLVSQQDGFAVTVINKDQKQIGVAIIQVQGERKAPLFIKIVQPGSKLDFKPEQAGPYLLSVKVFDTDETLRMENVQITDTIQFKKGKLKKLRRKS